MAVTEVDRNTRVADARGVTRTPSSQIPEALSMLLIGLFDAVATLRTRADLRVRDEVLVFRSVRRCGVLRWDGSTRERSNEWLPAPRGAARALRSWRLFLASGGFVLLLKPVDPSGRIYQLLSASKERVAGGADFHADIALVRGARPESVSARADNICLIIGRVNTSFHGEKEIPFENFQYSKNAKPRGSKTHGVQIA